MPITTVRKITGPVTVLIIWMKASASHLAFSAGPGPQAEDDAEGDRDDHPEPQLFEQPSLPHGHADTRSLNFQRVPPIDPGDDYDYDLHARRALSARHPLGLRRARVRCAAQAPRHPRRHPLRPPEGRPGRQGRHRPERRHHEPAVQRARGDLLRSPQLGGHARRRPAREPRDRPGRRSPRPGWSTTTTAAPRSSPASRSSWTRWTRATPPSSASTRSCTRPAG